MLGFLLTRQWRDTPGGLCLEFWWASEQGPVCSEIAYQEVVFFVPRAQANKVSQLLGGLTHWRMAEVALATFTHEPVNALYFKQHKQSRRAQLILTDAGIDQWETDIRPAERYLMERFITATAQITYDALGNVLLRAPTDTHFRPNLRILSLDIETSFDAKQLYSIALWGEDIKQVWIITPPNAQGHTQRSTDFLISWVENQQQLLKAFIDFIQRYDPDILIGWNLVQFDLWVLEQIAKKEQIALRIGRNQQACNWRQEEGDQGRRFVVIPGRQALDGIELLKAANYSFTRFNLHTVSQALLGEGKLLHSSSQAQDITDLYLNDQVQFATYNLKDCQLVWDIFIRQDLLAFALARSQLTGLLLDRIGGSVAAFEYSYLPRLHRQGFIAPNLGELQSDVISPGGWVMESKPGLYHNVLVLDFKSLYPSIIRSFLIDPCAFWVAQKEQPIDAVPGFNGAYFSRNHAILPQMITALSAARDEAKRHNNAPLSHAIKIIMNSFYGVLGSNGCRFFDPRVCSSITLRGHEIIQQSKKWIEEQGQAVIYGDTDSLFVWLEQNGGPLKSAAECTQVGTALAKGLNQWWAAHLVEQWSLECALEIQFETHFQRFLMPTLRGAETGTKKRYAGLIKDSSGSRLLFKGLESVRADWTQLAKDFQYILYEKIFTDEDYEQYIQATLKQVLQGELDKTLVFRKRLRRPLAGYEKTTPPHVQAARKYQAWTGQQLKRGDWVDYVMTVNGAEPLGPEEDFSLLKSRIDYEFYINKQLKPIADSILYFLGTKMQAGPAQMVLF
ncbi:MAG TPA: DNA polymerase II [Cellvibrionaceae bacterium]